MMQVSSLYQSTFSGTLGAAEAAGGMSLMTAIALFGAGGKMGYRLATNFQNSRFAVRHVEVALADGRRYLMGDRFTSADILLTTCLVWAVEYGVGVCDNALPYLARVTSRPAYTKSVEVNAAVI